MTASAPSEAAARQQAQNDLLRAVAHDLRAPQRHIASFAPLLLQACQDIAAHPAIQNAAQQDGQLQAHLDDVTEFAALMQQAATRMAQMTDALVLLSQASRAALHPSAVDWGQLCQQTAAGLGLSLVWADVDGGALPPPDPPVMLWADAHWLQRLVQEVLGNAAKFSARAPQPRVTLAAQRIARAGSGDEGACWQLVVQDNGVGFDMAHARHLFAPFQRMHRESDFPGLGAGLALVRAIASQHGAGVEISAAPAQGCRLTLTWPVAHAQAARPVATSGEMNSEIN